MRHTGTEIYSAFYDLLNGNVTYGGSTIPVYSGMPANKNEDYIYLEEMTQTDWEGHDRFGTEETFTIQIVCRDKGKVPSKIKVMNIASQVYNLIKPTVYSEVIMDNFTMTGLQLDNAFSDNLINDSDFLQRYIMTWRYFISEKPITVDMTGYTVDTTIITADAA